jgi:uncharacterized protein (DUF1778 family)
VWMMKRKDHSVALRKYEAGRKLIELQAFVSRKHAQLFLLERKLPAAERQRILDTSSLVMSRQLLKLAI